MSNMSYCRFQNTSRDLNDCLDALEEERPLSEDEYRAAIRMFRRILHFCQETGIIEDFNHQQLTRYLQERRNEGE